MKKIVTLTMNPSIDLNTSVDYVISERKLRCSSLRREAGGGGINVSRVIQRLGGASIALYPAGGPAGEMLKHLLDQEGVKHRPVDIDGWTRENFSILEEATNRQFRFGLPGPPLFEAEWEACLSEILSLDPTPDYVVASGSLPPAVPKNFFALLAEKAKELNCRLILDSSGEEVLLALKTGVYLIKPNLRELQELSGEDMQEEVQYENAARKLINRGCCEVIVISMGAAGALLVTKEGCEHFTAPAVPIESRIGAGDSMVGGIALSLAQGKSLKDAVVFGIAAGAATVMTPGTELCRREDVERIYERMDLGEHVDLPSEIGRADAPQGLHEPNGQGGSADYKAKGRGRYHGEPD